MKKTEKKELIYVTYEMGDRVKVKDIIKKVYGIGEKEYSRISAGLGLSSNQGRGVTGYERSKIDNYIKRRMKYTTEGGLDRNKKPIEQNLRAAKNSSILTLQNIKSYKGIRHRKGLPVNGQRTKTNAVTARRVR